MKPSVWFLVPAHGRAALTYVCLKQLARTCAELAAEGVAASAVIIAVDENVDSAHEFGFGTIETSNAWLGKRWNDGYEYAARQGVDYVIPFGSDDWVMTGWVLAQLDAAGEFRCSRQSSVVSEDLKKLATLEIKYENRGGPAFGDGVRMIPTELLHDLSYRPADDDRQRGIDTSIWMRVRNMLGREPHVSFTEVSPVQIVDWKSPEQLNSFDACLHFQTGELVDPLTALVGAYPDDALAEMVDAHALAVAA